MIFETCVVQTMLYGVEVWGGSISASSWNDMEKFQKKFLSRHLGVKTTTPYSVMLLETGRRPLEITTMQRVYKYIMKVKRMPTNCMPHVAWEIGCLPQKNYKSKFITSSWMNDIRKWFTKWNVEEFLTMHIQEGEKAEQELKFGIAVLDTLHMKWKTAVHKSKFEYYCKYINKEYWKQYTTCDPDAQVHIKTPMPRNARRAITLMRTRSHMLKIETGGWQQIDAKKRTCNVCDMERAETEEHVTLECPAYAHIRDGFQHLLQGCTTFGELLTKTQPSPTTLGMFLARLLEHHKSKTKDLIPHPPIS